MTGTSASTGRSSVRITSCSSLKLESRNSRNPTKRNPRTSPPMAAENMVTIRFCWLIGPLREGCRIENPELLADLASLEIGGELGILLLRQQDPCKGAAVCCSRALARRARTRVSEQHRFSPGIARARTSVARPPLRGPSTAYRYRRSDAEGRAQICHTRTAPSSVSRQPDEARALPA